MTKLPTLAELYSDADMALNKDSLNYLLNQPPPVNWVKEHPYIKGYKYLPIDKVEHLLRKIFKSYKIEILSQGTAFNAVWVTVRVHFKDLVTGEWSYHDGIGAAQLQTAKGTSAADLANINNGAVMMAYPIAKSLAIKDACDMFGALFGSNLNRRDVVTFEPDVKLNEFIKSNKDKLK